MVEWWSNGRIRMERQLGELKTMDDWDHSMEDCGQVDEWDNRQMGKHGGGVIEVFLHSRE
jgi:hypothetical protein